MFERKENSNHESSTIAEDFSSSKIRDVKKFVTFKIKQKEITSKEKRKQICKKYREKKKWYVKELETEIHKVQQELLQQKTNCDLSQSNNVQSLISSSMPKDMIAEFFGCNPDSYVNLFNSAETKLYLELLKIKKNNIIKDYLDTKDPKTKAMYKRMLLYVNNLLNQIQQLFNYYLHINAIEDL